MDFEPGTQNSEPRTRRTGYNSFVMYSRKNVSALCIVALLCGLYLLVVLVCMHFVRPDLNPFETPVSYYRADPDSYYLSSAFLAGALSEVILAVLLRFVAKPEKRKINRFGRYALLLAATSLFVTGLIRSGTAHWLGALVHTLLFPFAVMLVGYSTKEGIARRLSIIVSVCTAIMLLTLSEAFDGHALFHPVFGLLEKVDIVIMVAWSAMMLVIIYKASLESTFVPE